MSWAGSSGIDINGELKIQAAKSAQIPTPARIIDRVGAVTGMRVALRDD